jgi:redox-sensing transcriptional repressor
MRPIPSATVSRLVTYLRVLDRMLLLGEQQTSSQRLAAEARVSAFQVRKDLAMVGRIGKRGVGYEISALRDELRTTLGLTRPWHVAIVGMGRLGNALADYPNFEQYDFILKAFIDDDRTKVGKPAGSSREGAGDRVVEHLDELPRLVREREIDIAFLTVPHDSAQAAAEALVAAGIKGILNFAPRVIDVPEEVHVEPVDFLAGLKRLSFYIQKPRLKEELA